LGSHSCLFTLMCG